ncbi:MAG TPA: S16 family serine protease, partial [Polyangiaceae bacterium LLY-WYZ-15_(1-7)]|nr:S16 family serine protease [Polyangiaceae bacterium LLY-WYZ-15_(1-7)]
LAGVTLLERAALAGASKVRLARRALSHPVCWPKDAARRERLLAATSMDAPPHPKPGTAPFLTMSEGRATLWSLEPSAGGDGWVDLGRVAENAVETARQVVARDVAALAHPERLMESRSWRARRLAVAGTGWDHLVDGASLGVAAGLAFISELAGQPVPPDVVASATLGADGRVGPVEGLAKKLDVVAEWGLGLRRFIVAADQEEELRALSKARDLALEVHGVSEIAEVVDLVFPELFEDLQGRWKAQPSEAVRVARTLFELALENTRLLQDWAGFADTAGVVAEVVQGEDARREAEIARQIAERHIGRARPLRLDEGWLRGQRRPIRLRLLAHAVQAAADAAEDDEELEALARSQLAPDLDRTGEDFRLLGALGRFHAAEHRFDRARRDLRDAVDGWLDIGAIAQVSHPACELLRVLGVMGEVESLERFREEKLRRVLNDPRVDPVSRTFLALAEARALVQLGREQEGLARIEAVGHGWALAPRHVQASAERWRARALDVLGREAAAQEARARSRRIAQEGKQSASFCDALCRIDAALHERDEAAAGAAVEELGAHDQYGRDVERIARRVGDEKLANALARHWRY